MKFKEMCDTLFANKDKIAYNVDYPLLTANVRLLRDDANDVSVLYYFNRDAHTTPVAIINKTWDSDGWEVIDSLDERLNIANFMKMPNAKEFLEELYDLINSNWDGKFSKEFITKYKHRLEEAFALRIIYGDLNINRLVFTDIGYDLMKTL